jgi:nitroreductase
LTLDDLVHRRRSIRRYRSEPPPDAWLEAMVAAAILSPSPSNSQPVRFVRIQSEAVRGRLAMALARGYTTLVQAAEARSQKLKNRVNVYHRFSAFMNTAPILMAVGTPRESSPGLGGHLSEAGILPGDPQGESNLALTAGIALHAFLLKGAALGVGTCILTAPLVFIPEVAPLIEAQELKVRCFVTAGFPLETPAPLPHKPLSECYWTV